LADGETVRKTHVQRSTILVATWRARLPSVEDVRPERCWGCSRIHGREGYVLRGHGLQWRVVLGPLRPGGEAGSERVPCRRYFCPACCHLTVVVPLEHSAVFRYAMTAIVVALAMWALEGRTAGEVRDEIAARPTEGFGDPRLWPSLPRWVRQRDRLWPDLQVRKRATARATARAIVAALCARMPRAPPSPTVADAWEAALVR
jgi:hypothetical protein